MVNMPYKTILDKLPSAVFVCDKNCVIKYYNKSFFKIFEPSSRKKLIGSVINCCDSHLGCGNSQACKNCEIRKAFKSAIAKNKPTYTKKILKNVEINSKTKCLSFDLTVKPVKKNIIMGIIEDTVELNLYNQLMAARSIQQNMLPKTDNICGRKFSYFYHPCGEIGGDLIDVFNFGNKPCGFVADVSGKGIGAAMLSSFVKAAFDKNSESLSQAVTKLNDKYKDLKTDEREYITFSGIVIDEKNNELKYTSAGHNVPILLKSKNTVKELKISSPPISNWFENYIYNDYSQSYKNGDIIVLLTDGVTENKNKKGERFRLDRVKKVLLNSKDSKDFTINLRKEAEKFAVKASDDMSALAFDL